MLANNAMRSVRTTTAREGFKYGKIAHDIEIDPQYSHAKSSSITAKFKNWQDSLRFKLLTDACPVHLSFPKTWLSNAATTSSQLGQGDI